MKLRIIPVALTVVISGALLFGGWFGYRQIAQQNPLQNIVKEYVGVNEYQLEITRNEVVVKLDVIPGTKISGLVQQLTTEGKSIIGKRMLKLDVVDHSNDTLDEFWDQAMFPVAEAMENRQYTQIVEKLNKMEHNTTVKVTTEMDAKNVYVSLTDGEGSKFIILPREPGVLGVWNNA
ncbi:hypothetical protein ACP8HI_11610 [Paenibacillus sp. FA6]|uniref:hypothetical protein n=1 Tax=Paenibacillus sp. FA6 TaxID=3413029 RepID=UPI003F657B6F